jgi:ribose-phosphate pyrophosphokinase
MSVAAALLKQKGALDVHVLCTHGLFSGQEALDRVEASPVVEVVTTNTVSPSESVQGQPLIKHLDVSPLLTEAIRRQHFGEIGAYELEVNDIETW